MKFEIIEVFVKERPFRSSFNNQHVKGSQTLVKSAWEHFYHLFSSLRGEMFREVSPLLKFEIIGLFVGTLTNENFFVSFFVQFMKSTSNVEQVQKRKIVIANVFPKLKTVKDLVRRFSKKPLPDHPSTVNMLKGSKHLWNLHESTFIKFFHHSQEKWFRKYLPDWSLKS